MKANQVVVPSADPYKSDWVQAQAYRRIGRDLEKICVITWHVLFGGLEACAGVTPSSTKFALKCPIHEVSHNGFTKHPFYKQRMNTKDGHTSILC